MSIEMFCDMPKRTDLREKSVCTYPMSFKILNKIGKKLIFGKKKIMRVISFEGIDSFVFRISIVYNL